MMDIEEQPTVEAIPKGAYEQVRWERDMAIQQLADMGVQLGEKADVQAVRHGKWVNLEPEIGLYSCSLCEHNILRAKCNYCPNCGARMDGD